MSRTRSRLLATTGGVLVALVLVEVALRVAQPAYAPRSGQPAIVDVQETPPLFRLKPGSRFTHRWDGDPAGTLPEGASITYELDDLGFRSAGRGGAPHGLLVLGDSFTFGEGALPAQRFTEQLNNGHVYNAGVPGWSTEDEVAVLPDLLDRLRPRAVLIVAQPNDAVPIAHAQRRVEGDLLALSGDAPPLRLWGLLTAPRRARATEAWYRSYWSGALRRHGEVVGDALGDAKAACAQRRVRLGVACFPLLYRLDDAPLADVHEELGRMAVGHDIPFLDLYPAFAGRDAAALHVHPTDHHPNAAAHALAAAALEPFVESLLR